MIGVMDSVVNQILTKIDGPKQLHNILVIGMTNRIDMLDVCSKQETGEGGGGGEGEEGEEGRWRMESIIKLNLCNINTRTR